MAGKEVAEKGAPMYLISIKPKNKWRHVSVDKDIYIYIHQLEAYINNPAISKLKERYPERFDGS